jgi:hypothetical protein
MLSPRVDKINGNYHCEFQCSQTTSDQIVSIHHLLVRNFNEMVQTVYLPYTDFRKT